MASSNFGLYQKAGSKPGAVFPTWLMRRTIPLDVRHRFDGRSVFKATTGETDRKAALRVAEPKWRQWGEMIADARSLGLGDALTMPQASFAIDQWRQRECDAAATIVVSRPEPPIMAVVRNIMGPSITTLSSNVFSSDPENALNVSAIIWADKFYTQHPDASYDIGTPYAVGQALLTWQEASGSPEGWTCVPGFDDAMNAAVAAGGGQGVLPRVIREAIRQSFAKAAHEVERHREYQRTRAAVIKATVKLQKAGPASITTTHDDATIVPTADDRTVAQVTTAYLRWQWLKRLEKKTKAEKAGEKASSSDKRGAAEQQQPDAEESKKYSHLARIVEELLGAEKIFRSITREDVRTVLATLRLLPSNARKHYPGKSLAYAIEHAEDEDRELLASKTIVTYMREFHTMCGFAIVEGWHTSNPVDGQVPSTGEQLKRRGPSFAEKELIFGGLRRERVADSGRWWVPSVLAFTGARAGEICQLRLENVKSADGNHYLDLTVFDAAGRRRADASLKTKHSARKVPLHPELIKAGFLEFVDRRRAEGAERLFPDLKRGPNGGYTHELSKWFGNYLDGLGLTDPTLTLHGFRHGFKDAGRVSKIDNDVILALGGWAPVGEGNRYGDRDNLAVNAPAMARITFSGFTLGTPETLLAAA